MVEVSERKILRDDLARDVLVKIQELGIELAVDDFGTGYSGLANLTKFPVQWLKIDKTFVEAIGTESPTSQVVLHIIEIARSLQLKVIAEGVETAEQAEFLLKHGVYYGQGWLFARAMSADDLVRDMEKSS